MSAKETLPIIKYGDELSIPVARPRILIETISLPTKPIAKFIKNSFQSISFKKSYPSTKRSNIEFEFSLYSNNILSVDSYIEYRSNIYEPFFREEGEVLSLDLKRGEAFIPRKYEALYNSIKLLSKTNFDMLAYTIFEKIDFSDVDFLKAIDCFNNKLKEHTLKYCKKVGLDTNNDSKVFEVIDRMYGVRIGGLSDDDAYIISEFLINHLFYSYNKEDELIDYITSLNK